MKKVPLHTGTKAADRQTRAFFSCGSFRWKINQDQVWAHLKQRMKELPRKRKLVLSVTWWAAAAAVLFLVGTAAFMRFYAVTENAPPGGHLRSELPDGSVAELNASTTLTYRPYWWFAGRNLELDGEAFFDIFPGRKFTVSSLAGKTEVLGTSFNIFSRDAVYNVTCISGRVRVISSTGSEAVLLPQNKAEILANGDIMTTRVTDTYPTISWRNNEFIFTARPVRFVFSEIERQYNIRINNNFTGNPVYTGNFTREQNVEEVLSYICPVLYYKFTRISRGVYTVVEGSK